MEYIYKAIFCIFMVVGVATSLSAVTDFYDTMIFSMLVPNIFGLTLLLSNMKTELLGCRKVIHAIENR